MGQFGTEERADQEVRHRSRQRRREISAASENRQRQLPGAAAAEARGDQHRASWLPWNGKCGSADPPARISESPFRTTGCAIG